METFGEHCATRRATVEQAAKEQSVSVGEADLRRMKRQFSSLKNTFLHYEVKDEFIAALADGLPNGTEDIQLQQFEDEAERNIEMLREWKGKNTAKQEEIRSLIDILDTKMVEIDTETRAALEDLRVLFDEMAELEAFEKDAAVDIEPGMDEEECAKIIEEESTRAKELESRLIASLEELNVLEGKVPDMSQEVDMLKEEIGDIQSSLDVAHTRKQNADTSKSAGASRQQYTHAKTAVWALESTRVLQSVSGVVNVEMVGTSVKLTNITLFPVTSVVKSRSNEALMASNMESIHHSIELVLDEKTGHVIGGNLAPSPSCYPALIDDIVDKTLLQGRYATVERVLGEARICLSGYHHRRSLIEHEVRTAMESVDNVSPDSCHFTCVTKSGILVEVEIQSCWPEYEDCFKIVSCQSATEQKTQLVSKSFDGFASLAQALDQV